MLNCALHGVFRNFKSVLLGIITVSLGFFYRFPLNLTGYNLLSTRNWAWFTTVLPDYAEKRHASPAVIDFPSKLTEFHELCLFHRRSLWLRGADSVELPTHLVDRVVERLQLKSINYEIDERWWVSRVIGGVLQIYSLFSAGVFLLFVRSWLQMVAR